MRAGVLRRRRWTVAAITIGLLAAATPFARADLYDEPVLELVDVVVVDAAGESTFRYPLKAGQPYLFVAEGRYSYGPAGDGDAECSSGPGDPIFRRERYPDNVLDLLLNGYAHEWQAVAPTLEGCSATHTYTFQGTPGTTEWTRVNIKDTFAGDNSGRLVVALYRVDCRDDVRQCVPPAPAPPPLPDLPDLPELPKPPGGPGIPPLPDPEIPTLPTLPDIPPDVPPDPWPPEIPDVPGVPDVPDLPGPPNPPPLPSPPPPPPLPPNPVLSSQVSETVYVDASDADGVTSKQVFQAGRTYDFVVSGRYRYGAGTALADAECAQGASDPTFQRSRFPEPTLDLVLNGYAFDWESPTLQPCDPEGTYRLTVEASGTGRVQFKVADSSYGDNVGVLAVTVITRPLVAAVPNPGTAPGDLVETVVVDARDWLGVHTLKALQADRTYQFVATGAWSTASALGDAECAAPLTAPASFTAGGTEAELTVNYGDVQWLPVTGGGACDLGHTYRWTVRVTAPGGNPVLRIHDSGSYLDNAGYAVVTIYEVR